MHAVSLILSLLPFMLARPLNVRGLCKRGYERTNLGVFLITKVNSRLKSVHVREKAHVNLRFPPSGESNRSKSAASFFTSGSGIFSSAPFFISQSSLS